MEGIGFKIPYEKWFTNLGLQGQHGLCFHLCDYGRNISFGQIKGRPENSLLHTRERPVFRGLHAADGCLSVAKITSLIETSTKIIIQLIALA
ncbi:MAG: hypothetical protein MZU95_12220 [Desulfomicrobium escambiense]|nr:hypothetical protein [Desulfomicrobium escambiense]